MFSEWEILGTKGDKTHLTYRMQTSIELLWEVDKIGLVLLKHTKAELVSAKQI